jgi:hypothetical protein
MKNGNWFLLVNDFNTLPQGERFVKNLKALGPVALLLLLLTSRVHGEEHPCSKIREACSKAGFMPGQAKSNKGLIKNCMRIIIKGGSVPGVAVSSEEAKACAEKKESRKKK